MEFSSWSVYFHLWTSLSELVTGLVFATIIGITIGFCAGWFRHANYVLDLWITVLYSTPKVALVPLIILLLGIDFTAKVFVVALMSVFSTSSTRLSASRRRAARSWTWLAPMAPPSANRSPRSSCPPQPRTSSPGIWLSVGHGMIGVVVAELVAGNHGLGFLDQVRGFHVAERDGDPGRDSYRDVGCLLG